MKSSFRGSRLSGKAGVRRKAKVLGQHFLRDRAVAERIVRAPGALDQAHVLEIGAGTGVLTGPLAVTAARVTALEIDPGLAGKLARSFEKLENVAVIREDVLKFDLASWARQCDPLRPVVMGNIPYGITNTLVHHLICNRGHLGLVVLMVQEEVARRITAPAGTKQYGMLSVLAGYHAALEYLFFVGRDSFRPSPRVDSAVISLDFSEKPSVRASDEEFFEKLVRRLFQDRRKQVQKILRTDNRYGLDRDSLDELARQTGLDLSCRPERLAVDQFVRLADTLAAISRK